ncbi:hypothetical protein [Roseobacter weihaiensis]|uniref:hypothetical protein n=1 Tax=Roseobacter weihaiensis TaxID=2763262 RepID=UPI001D09DE2C|nr:hypothetical protein [Roseobacter sp. H9]
MRKPISRRDLRQVAYRQRASSARLYARLLMPVTVFVLATGLWSDPVVGPQLVQGLEEIRPIAASYLVDTPLENILGPAPATEDTVDAADVEGRVTASTSLPPSVVPINRN